MCIRDSAYGGDINGRLKLTLEVIAEVRKICGKDFIIDVRISGDEYSDGGPVSYTHLGSTVVTSVTISPTPPFARAA